MSKENDTKNTPADEVEKDKKFDEFIRLVGELTASLRGDEKSALEMMKQGKHGFVVASFIKENIMNVAFHLRKIEIAFFNEYALSINSSYKEGSMVFDSKDVVITKSDEQKCLDAITDITKNGKAVIMGTRNNAKGSRNILLNAAWKVVDCVMDGIAFIEGELVAGEDIFIADLSKNIYEKIMEDARNERSKYLDKVEGKTSMKGDIIITDPCYIVKHRDYSTAPDWADFHPYKSLKDYPDYDGEESLQFRANQKRMDEAHRKWDRENPDDWDDFDGTMQREGITNYLRSRTMVGDWSCETVNKDTGEVIGKLGADSGEVGVFLVEDIKRYNPEFFNTDHSHIATIIKDFDGSVRLDLSGSDGVVVIGEGNVNFYTRPEVYEEEE